MNNLIFQVYQSTRTSYIKLRIRLKKNIANGRFQKFSKKRQNQLLHKVERLRRRVLQLQVQLKLAVAGSALSLLLSTSPLQGQTTLGPFVRNYIDNPLPPPLPYFERPAPVYVDLDGDADLDLVVGEGNRLSYFKNIGSVTKPFFIPINQGNPEYPFNNVASAIPGQDAWVPAFADVDADGDMDLLVGTDDSKYGFFSETFFFKNQGTSANPDFVQETGSYIPDPINPGNSTGNPFDGISSRRFAHPTFADLDNDGDTDLLLGGYYSASTYDYLIQYFENTGTPSVPAYVKNTSLSLVQRGVGNHLNYAQNRDESPSAFADLDEDGDLDFFFNTYENGYGTLVYLRNDGGVFTGVEYDLTQTGPWMPDPSNPGQYLGNPFYPVNPFGSNSYTSIAFADLDNDGDLDVTLGFDIYISIYDYNVRSLMYYENMGKGVLQLREGLNSPLDGIDLGENSNSSLADIDQDGDMDILASGFTSFTYCPDGCFSITQNFVSVFKNEGGVFTDITGTAEDNISGLPFNEHAKVLLMDVNGDGLQDVVVPHFTTDNYGTILSSNIQFFANVGGVYQEKTGVDNPFSSLTLPNKEFNLTLGDLDGDGKDDLILGVAYNPLSAYQNTGTVASPVFTLKPEWNTGFVTSHYAGSNPQIIDLDHDGDLDIIVGKYRSTWYYENIGTPSNPSFVEYKDDNNFSDATNVNNPFKNLSIFVPSSPTLFDLDGDGDLDLLQGDGIGQFSYFENTNPAPVTTLNSTGANFFFGSGSVVLDASLALSDTDGDFISSARVSIQNFQPGEEILTFTPQGGIMGAFDAATGVLTLSGQATAAIYQSVLRTVRYEFVGAKPAAGGKEGNPSGKTVVVNKSVTFQVFDSDFTAPAIASIALQLNFANEVPVLAGSTSSVLFTGTPIIINNSVTLADADDADLEGATVRITPASFVSGQDNLAFTNQNGISGSFNTSNGTLTLTGISSVANYQAALRSVQFQNSNTAPNSQIRIVEFTVTDGENNSNTEITQVLFNVNQPPAIIPTTLLTVINGQVTLDLNTIISDPDGNLDPNSFNIVQNPARGAVATIANGVLTLDYSSSSFAGTDTMVIEAFDLLGERTEAIITINVAGEVVVRNGISVNGDNLNPIFLLENIAILAPDNQVTIFNRWGDKVFEIDRYDNLARRFDGTSDDGGDLPSGIYFYKIKLNNGQPDLEGYLTLKR